MSELMVHELPGYDNIKEVLIATPHAVLHYKIIFGRTETSSKTRILTDVRAMSPDWWTDRVRKLKAHDFYRRMEIAGRKHRKDIQPVLVTDMKAVIDVYELEPLLRSDEKARNALMTAMGHHADMVHEADFRGARETAEEARKELKRTQAAAATKERALADADWGMF